MFDPDYKLKHRPPQAKRLLFYKRLPPRMVGDPYILPWSNWKQRCEILYLEAMRQKQGLRSTAEMRGLWSWLP
jgi:hypothetical protein